MRSLSFALNVTRNLQKNQLAPLIASSQEHVMGVVKYKKIKFDNLSFEQLMALKHGPDYLNKTK